MNEQKLISFNDFPIFSCLNEKEKKSLKDKCFFQSYDPGSTIIEQGDESNTVYFLLSGTVHIVDYSRSDKAVTYASLKYGEMFGEMSAIDGLPRSAWVSTITPCRVAALPGFIFLDLLKNNFEISLIILKQLSLRIRLADERFTDVSILGTEQRACMELIRMSKLDTNYNDKYIIQEMPTQANFANMIGSTRETVSRIFTKLREDSVIIKTTEGYIIPNRKTLEKRAFS